MEGKLIRKYREIFSRVPQNNHTIKDILRFLEDDGMIVVMDEEERIELSYRNLLEKTTLTDWLRSRGVRHMDIVHDDQNKKIVCHFSFCSYFQCVIEYVLFLKTNNINKELFHKSIYATEHSRDIKTEKKYKWS
jgi:hypothetical protein